MLRRRASRGVAETLWLPDALRSKFEAEADEYAPCETGGMLIGYASGTALVITQTVMGGPKAVRKRTRFEPDGVWQQRELERIYRYSGQIETYLGDWHSHPSGTPVPSRLDKKTAIRVARRRAARCKHPVTLILGGKNGCWEIAPFYYRGREEFSTLSLAGSTSCVS